MVILASLQSFILKVTRNVDDIVNANIKSDFPTNKNDESCRVRKTISFFTHRNYVGILIRLRHIGVLYLSAKLGRCTKIKCDLFVE